MEKLRSDYYGEYGRQFLSNSDIGILINNPRQFGVPREDTKAMLEGRYFHTIILEPEKLRDFIIVDASTRNTNLYKSALESSGESMLLLKSEADELTALANTLKGNMEVCDMVYAKGALYEEPTTGMVQGHMFKGKADIVTSDMVIDIKTTSDIMDFKWSAKKYNYDSQAYIYQTLFGKPLTFIAIDKTSHLIGIFTPSQDMIKRGEEKVEQALIVYNQFFGPSPTHDINQYLIYQTI